MKKASEYRQHAEECRALARGLALGPHREQLLEMAQTWEKLAAERADFVRRHPEMAIDGEHAEEEQERNPAIRGLFLPQKKAAPALRTDGAECPYGQVE